MTALTREDIVLLAQEAGFDIFGDVFLVGHDGEEDIGVIERFAALVAAHEREACATVCESSGNQWSDRNARMQHHTGAGIGALKCADLIRARNN